MADEVCIQIDPSAPLEVTPSTLRAELQLARDPVMGGKELEGLSGHAMQELNKCVKQIGIWGLPYLEPHQVKCPDLWSLVHAL